MASFLAFTIKALISCLVRDCELVQQKYYRFWSVSTASSSFLLDELKVTEPKKISPYYCLKTPSRFTKLTAAQIGHPWPSFALLDVAYMDVGT